MNKSSLNSHRRSVESAIDAIGLFEQTIKEDYHELDITEVTLTDRTKGGSSKRPLVESVIVVRHATKPMSSMKVNDLLRDLPKKFRDVPVTYDPPLLSLRESA